MNQNQTVIAEEIVSRTRTAELNAKRMVVCLELRSQGLSLTAIGKMVNRNHSTVIHLINRANDLLSVKDPLLVNALKSYQHPELA